MSFKPIIRSITSDKYRPLMQRMMWEGFRLASLGHPCVLYARTIAVANDLQLPTNLVELTIAPLGPVPKGATPLCAFDNPAANAAQDVEPRE